MMNIEQRFVYDRVLDSIRTGGCFSLDGKAGRGKTYLVNAIYTRIRGQGRIACITGSMALSTTLYERGRTAHSMFGIPVNKDASNLVSEICLLWKSRDHTAYGLDRIGGIPDSEQVCVEYVDVLLRSIMRNKRLYYAICSREVGSHRVT
jgi:hypothetical protein